MIGLRKVLSLDEQINDCQGVVLFAEELSDGSHVYGVRVTSADTDDVMEIEAVSMEKAQALFDLLASDESVTSIYFEA